MPVRFRLERVTTSHPRADARRRRPPRRTDGRSGLRARRSANRCHGREIDRHLVGPRRQESGRIRDGRTPPPVLSGRGSTERTRAQVSAAVARPSGVADIRYDEFVRTLLRIGLRLCHGVARTEDPGSGRPSPPDRPGRRDRDHAGSHPTRRTQARRVVEPACNRARPHAPESSQLATEDPPRSNAATNRPPCSLHATAQIKAASVRWLLA